jgi:Ran GTPase-activating protein (RanGAP) involved in mRNA processing and transport
MLTARPNVVEVLLMNNAITTTGAAPLCQALSRCQVLKTLDMSNNQTLFADDMTAKYFGELLRHQTLERLILKSCGLTLTSVCMLANAFKDNTALEHLDVRANNLGNESLLAICPALERHRCITSLNFADNREINDEGAGHILALLQKNPNITDVNLNGTKVSEWMIGAIRDQISSNCSLVVNSENPFNRK